MVRRLVWAAAAVLAAAAMLGAPATALAESFSPPAIPWPGHPDSSPICPSPVATTDEYDDFVSLSAVGPINNDDPKGPRLYAVKVDSGWMINGVPFFEQGAYFGPFYPTLDLYAPAGSEWDLDPGLPDPTTGYAFERRNPLAAGFGIGLARWYQVDAAARHMERSATSVGLTEFNNVYVLKIDPSVPAGSVLQNVKAVVGFNDYAQGPCYRDLNPANDTATLAVHVPGPAVTSTAPKTFSTTPAPPSPSRTTTPPASRSVATLATLPPTPAGPAAVPSGDAAPVRTPTTTSARTPTATPTATPKADEPSSPANADSATVPPSIPTQSSSSSSPATDDGGPAADRQPDAVLAQQSVPEGGSDGVSASGFAPGEQVTATLHSQPLELGTYPADDTGRLTVNFTVPANFEPGLHTVELLGASGRSLSVPLQVTAPPGRRMWLPVTVTLLAVVAAATLGALRWRRREQ